MSNAQKVINILVFAVLIIVCVWTSNVSTTANNTQTNLTTHLLNDSTYHVSVDLKFKLMNDSTNSLKTALHKEVVRNDSTDVQYSRLKKSVSGLWVKQKQLHPEVFQKTTVKSGVVKVTVKPALNSTKR